MLHYSHRDVGRYFLQRIFIFYIQAFTAVLVTNTEGTSNQDQSNHSNVQLNIEPTKPNLTALDTSIGFLCSISSKGASNLHRLKSHVSL